MPGKILSIVSDLKLRSEIAKVKRPSYSFHLFQCPKKALWFYDQSKKDFTICIVDDGSREKSGISFVYDLKYANPDQKVVYIGSRAEPNDFPDKFQIDFLGKYVTAPLLEIYLESWSISGNLNNWIEKRKISRMTVEDSEKTVAVLDKNTKVEVAEGKVKGFNETGLSLVGRSLVKEGEDYLIVIKDVNNQVRLRAKSMWTNGNSSSGFKFEEGQDSDITKLIEVLL